MVISNMYFSSSKAALASGLSVDTLRYYEKLGLFPQEQIQRDVNGYRCFSSKDIQWIEFIVQLRDTGMSLERIQVLVELARAGDKTIFDRQSMLKEHLIEIERRMSRLRDMQKIVEKKIRHYDALRKTDALTGCESGTPCN